jgi:hypothetical protein
MTVYFLWAEFGMRGSMYRSLPSWSAIFIAISVLGCVSAGSEDNLSRMKQEVEAERNFLNIEFEEFLGRCPRVA